MSRRSPLLPGLLSMLWLSSAALGQQTYVTRYDVYAGYAFLDSPSIGLFENGAQFQIGMRQNRWLTLGFDYSYSRGDLALTPDKLPDALRASLQQQLAGLVKAGIIPANYALTVPASSVSQTFAMGPQFSYRGIKAVTPFVRPSFGAIREAATPKPTDAVARGIVANLAPTGKKLDWQGFYGVGYGIDFNFSRHFALRVQGDLVYDHLFNDLLKDGRWTTRFSVGPAINFGRNIVE